MSLPPMNTAYPGAPMMTPATTPYFPTAAQPPMAYATPTGSK